MKKMIVIAFAFVALSICSVAASAQVTRIHFAPGATSKVVTGTLNGFKGQRKYVIRVRAGQTISTESLLPENSVKYISIELYGPPGAQEDDMDMSCHSSHELPTTAGDYQITVYECKKADPWKGTFKFRVTVR